MQNEAGVIMHLKAKRTGLMLSLGGDAVVISMSPITTALVTDPGHTHGIAADVRHAAARRRH